MSNYERVHILETRCGTCLKLKLQECVSDVYCCPNNRRLHYVKKTFAEDCEDYEPKAKEAKNE